MMLTENDRDAVQEASTKSTAVKCKTPETSHHSIPIPPPRPPETLKKSATMGSIIIEPHDIDVSASFPVDKSRRVSETTSSVSSPPFPPSHHRLQSSYSTPVPPPRPIETLTSKNTVILPREALMEENGDGDFDQSSPLTPPPIPSRDPIILESERQAQI